MVAHNLKCLQTQHAMQLTCTVWHYPQVGNLGFSVQLAAAQQLTPCRMTFPEPSFG